MITTITFVVRKNYGHDLATTFKLGSLSAKAHVVLDLAVMPPVKCFTRVHTVATGVLHSTWVVFVPVSDGCA